MVKFRSLLLASLAAAGLATAAYAATFSFDPTAPGFAYTNEFTRYAEADWTLTTTEAGAGSATEALTTLDGGGLLITNDAADDDRDFYQTAQLVKYDSTKRLFFKARFKISDATQSDFVFGLQITDTTPLAVSNGIWFQKDDGDANIDFHVAAASVQTDVTALATVTADTFVTLAFYYDPSAAKIVYFVNDVAVGSAAITNAPSSQELAISFGLQNGEAVAKTMTVDYITVYKER